MAGFEGVITRPNGVAAFRCESCFNLKQPYEHDIPAGVDPDQFAAEHREAEHKYQVRTPV